MVVQIPTVGEMVVSLVTSLAETMDLMKVVWMDWCLAEMKAETMLTEFVWAGHLGLPRWMELKFQSKLA